MIFLDEHILVYQFYIFTPAIYSNISTIFLRVYLGTKLFTILQICICICLLWFDAGNIILCSHIILLHRYV